MGKRIFGSISSEGMENIFMFSALFDLSRSELSSDHFPNHLATARDYLLMATALAVAQILLR